MREREKRERVNIPLQNESAQYVDRTDTTGNMFT